MQRRIQPRSVEDRYALISSLDLIAFEVFDAANRFVYFSVPCRKPAGVYLRIWFDLPGYTIIQLLSAIDLASFG